jgi:hypothetical protein
MEYFTGNGRKWQYFVLKFTISTEDRRNGFLFARGWKILILRWREKIIGQARRIKNFGDR